MKKLTLILCLSFIFKSAYTQAVGIGTTSPSDALHIVGAANDDPLRVQVGTATKLRVFNNGGTSIGVNNTSGTPANGLYVDGNTGLGIGNPTDKLSVNGDLNIIGEIKTDGVSGTEGQVLQANGDGTMMWSAMANNSEDGGFGPWDDYCNDKITEYLPMSNTNGSSGDEFGSSVAMSGNYAIVGASGDQSASIYKRNNSNGQWEFHSKITHNGSSSFGNAVDIQGDFIIIGDQNGGGSNSKGYATIYKRNPINDNWESQGDILNPSGQDQDLFGCSVALQGNYAIVGAYRDHENGLSDNGSATIFRRNNSTGIWEVQVKLINDNPETNDFFGRSVDIYGDYSIVGAFGDSEGGFTSNGSATIYKRNTSTNNWESQGKLINTNSSNGEFFGFSVSISNDFALIGAYQDSEQGFTSNGSVSVYKKSTSGNYTFQTKILNPSQGNGDDFGISTKISGDFIIVGAFEDDENGQTNNGSTSIFRKYGNSWKLIQKFINPNSNNLDKFGRSVSIDGFTKRFIVGAPDSQSFSGLSFFGKVK